MHPDVPPPLPNLNAPSPAWRTYLGAVVFLFPAINVWFFSTVFLLPRLERIWQQAGLTHSRAQWLVDVSRFCLDNGRWVFAVIVVSFIVLEARVRAWQRYRWRIVVGIVFVLNTAVLVGLTLLCIAALLAVPVISKSH